MHKVFIDGKAGTTGLRIYDRLAKRSDLQLLTLPEAVRKDDCARQEMLNSCDVAFLCLPDDASREAVGWIENPDVVVLDTSTAHRTLPGWAYGFPELSQERRDAVISGKRIAVPGCHASGFIALVTPLLAAGLLSPDVLLCCTSLTGYSGGGKKMIADYEAENRSPLLDAPRQYSLSQQHKHLKEMTAIPGLQTSPIFCPIVADYYSGMEVSVPLFRQYLQKGADAETIKALYQDFYQGPIVRYAEDSDENGLLSACKLSGRDSMELSVFGSDDRILLTARYDNLGKGASGAAIECMNLVLGVAPTTGLDL